MTAERQRKRLAKITPEQARLGDAMKRLVVMESGPRWEAIRERVIEALAFLDVAILARSPLGIDELQVGSLRRGLWLTKNDLEFGRVVNYLAEFFNHAIGVAITCGRQLQEGVIVDEMTWRGDGI
jgi:hypothetical protein